MPRQSSATLSHSVDQAADGGRGRLGVVVATVTANLFLFLGSAVLGAIASISGWIPPRRYWPGLMARLWGRGVLASSGVRLHVEGTHRLDSQTSYVVMSNHTSLMDIPVLLASFPGSLCFVAKQELFSIPVFGWGMRAAGFIPVDRRDRSRAADVVHGASHRLEHGDSVVIFPEETRSPDGRLLTFQRGGFLMAIRSRRPILPVGIRGCRTVRHKGGLLVHPGLVEVHYGEPLDVTSFGIRNKGELMAQMRETIGRLAAVESDGFENTTGGDAPAGPSARSQT